MRSGAIQVMINDDASSGVDITGYEATLVMVGSESVKCMHIYDGPPDPHGLLTTMWLHRRIRNTLCPVTRLQDCSHSARIDQRQRE